MNKILPKGETELARGLAGLPLAGWEGSPFPLAHLWVLRN